jgi:transcription initiation factor TFIIIB Brf1 subunit/transcription initiation factor TFIIB
MWKPKIGGKMNRAESATPKRLRVGRVHLYCRKLWQDQPLIAEKIASEVLLILTQAYELKPCFFSGKSEKGILSGLFYHLSKRYKSIKTQHVIARSLKTTEMTVRASYRDWVKHFPKLLNDFPRKEINTFQC